MPEKSGYTDTFNEFLGELHTRMDQARGSGMSTEDIQKNAERVGDWLARSVTPRTPEQRVLQELWQVSNEREQQAMANAMVRLVDRSGRRNGWGPTR